MNGYSRFLCGLLFIYFAYHFTVVGMGEAFANSLGVHYQRIQF